MPLSFTPQATQSSEAARNGVFKNYQALPIKPIDIVQVFFDFDKEGPQTIPLVQNEIVYVLSKTASGWWDGIIFKDSARKQPVRGWFPQSFTRPTQLLDYVKLRLSQQELADLQLYEHAGGHAASTGQLNPQSPQSQQQLARKDSVASSNHKSPSLSKESLGSSVGDANTKGQAKDQVETKSAFSEGSVATSDTRTNDTALSQKPFANNNSNSNKSQLELNRLQHTRSNANSLSSANDSSAIYPVTTASSANSRILSLKDAEKLVLLKFGRESMVYWLPQVGPEGRTLYYNADLDVYCNELPFSSGTSDVDLSFSASPLVASDNASIAGTNNSSSTSIFNEDFGGQRPYSTSNYADVVSSNASAATAKRGQKIVNFFKGFPKKPYDEKSSKYNSHAGVRRAGTTPTNNSSNSNVNNNNNSSHSTNASSVHSNNSNSSVKVGLSKKLHDESGNESSASATPQSNERPSSIGAAQQPSLFMNKQDNKSEVSLKRPGPSPHETKHSYSHSPSHTRSASHPRQNIINYENLDSFSGTDNKAVSRNIYDLSELFIKHPKDITTWDGFKDTLFSLLDSAVNALGQNDQQGFNVIINYALKVSIIIHIMARLSHEKLVKCGFEVPIKRRLKKISRSVAQIIVNGNLYLNIRELEEPFDGASANNSNNNNNSDNNNTPSNDTNSVDFDNDDFDLEDRIGGSEENLKTGQRNDASSRANDESTDHFTFGSQNSSRHPSTVLAGVATFANIPATVTKSSFISERSGDYELKQAFDKSSSQSYLEVVKIEIKILKRHVSGCYKAFQKVADSGDDKQLKIPQVYPRFLAGFFSGGNWQNPFFDDYLLSKSGSITETNASSGEVAAIEAKRKELAMKEFQQRSKKLIKLSNENLKVLTVRVKNLFDILDEILHHVNQDINIHNNKAVQQRNMNIISTTYKTLASSSIIQDVLESFDLSIFNSQLWDKEDGSRLVTSSNFTNYNILVWSKSDTASIPLKDKNNGNEKERGIMSIVFPILIEFFEVRQDLYNALSELLMDSQLLSAQDKSVFQIIKANQQKSSFSSSSHKNLSIDDLANDLKEALILCDNIDAFDNGGKNPFESFDKNFKRTIKKIRDSSSILLIIIGQLIEEKESLIRYAERVMQGNLTSNQGEYGRYFAERKVDLSDTGYLIDDEKIAKNYPTEKKKVTEEVPWFLDSDDEYDLYYDAKGEIKGGSKEVLVTHLTNHEHFDPNFNKVFLSTFRSMMTPGELISYLIARFNTEAPEGLSFEEFDIWSKKKLYPIRLRCVNVMKMLLQKYWIDVFSEDTEALEAWLKFAEHLVKKKFPSLKIIYNEIRSKLDGTPVIRRGASGIGSISQSIVPPSLEAAPKSIIPKPSGAHKHLRLFDIDHVEFARQLTIRDFALYSQITLLQCLDKVWKNKYGSFGGSKHIAEFINNSNRLTDYVSHMVLRKHDINKRAKVISYFIKVAEECFRINNFSSMTAIVSSLYSSAIDRLHKTWDLIDSKSRSILKEMSNLMDPYRNFYRYREIIKHIQGVPCVPFVGIYLSDLTFIIEGTPDYLNGDPNVINFYKRAKMESIIGNILRYQSINYAFNPVSSIQKFIDKGYKEYQPSVDYQFKVSLILEPRQSASAQWNNINALRAAKMNLKSGLSSKNTTTTASAANSTAPSISSEHDTNSADAHSTSSKEKDSKALVKEYINSGLFSSEEVKKLMDYFDEESSDDTDNDNFDDNDVETRVDEASAPSTQNSNKENTSNEYENEEDEDFSKLKETLAPSSTAAEKINP